MTQSVGAGQTPWGLCPFLPPVTASLHCDRFFPAARIFVTPRQGTKTNLIASANTTLPVVKLSLMRTYPAVPAAKL